MPAGSILRVISTRMRSEQPVGPTCKISSRVGPNHEMYVIWHQTHREDRYGRAHLRHVHQLYERFIVTRVMEYFGLLVGAIDEVIAPIRKDDSGRPRHRVECIWRIVRRNIRESSGCELKWTNSEMEMGSGPVFLETGPDPISFPLLARLAPGVDRHVLEWHRHAHPAQVARAEALCHSLRRAGSARRCSE